jgi:hypothetical protein
MVRVTEMIHTYDEKVRQYGLINVVDSFQCLSIHTWQEVNLLPLTSFIFTFLLSFILHVAFKIMCFSFFNLYMKYYLVLVVICFNSSWLSIVSRLQIDCCFTFIFILFLVVLHFAPKFVCFCCFNLCVKSSGSCFHML